VIELERIMDAMHPEVLRLCFELYNDALAARGK
jgi:hypothetical protein